MAQRITARATLENGSMFSVEFANLTPRSVFIITDRRLSFRENVKLALEGIELRGEVVFVAQENPRGAVLVLESTAAAHGKLARWMESGEVLHASAPDEMWSDSTEPAPPMEPPQSLDENTSEDAKIDPNLLLAAFLDNQPVVMDVDTDELVKETFDSSGDDTAIQIQLPELKDDGTLKFATAADYKAQYSTDIVNGGLIARSAPLPIGTQKMVRISVPGLKEPVALSARVGFVGSGTVGLMIDSFSKYRQVFDKLFNDLT